MTFFFMALFLSFALAQEPLRGIHEGESFELSVPIPNTEDNRYTASNYIKLLPGFASNPTAGTMSLLNLGLEGSGVYQPENGYTNKNNSVVGTIGGTIDIGAMGGLVYTIPIEIPKGINNMQPNLSIQYNSQSGNGLLGWGWDLCGISSITRTGQTLYHDGNMTAVDFSREDRFMLDGQRLIAVEGESATPFPEYRTENDCFARIIDTFEFHLFKEEEDLLTTFFKVWDKSGNVMEYKESLQTAGGNGKMLWMISRMMDRYGNAVIYNYYKDTDTGEIRISSIEYTVNEANETKAEFVIGFEYQTNREDYEKYYIGGSPLLHKSLLSEITVSTKNDNKPIVKYRFEYPTWNNTKQRQYYVLLSIEKLAYDENGVAEKFDKTVINWDNTNPNSVVKKAIPNSTIFAEFPFTGDFNGDGYTDVATVPYKASGQNNYSAPVDIKVFLNNRQGGFEHAASMDLVSFYNNLDWIYVLDFNGDGLDDIVTLYCNRDTNGQTISSMAFAFLNQGENNAFSMEGAFMGIGENIFLVGDFDGNGTADFVALEKKDFEVHIDHNVYGTQDISYLNNIRWLGFEEDRMQNRLLNSTPIGQRLGPVYDAVAADFDGDGTSEVFLIGVNISSINNYGSKLVRLDFSGSNDGLEVLKTFTMDNTPSYYSLQYWPHVFPGDFNGDGKADIVYFHHGSWRIGLSKGEGLDAPFYEIPSGGNIGLPPLNYGRNIFYPSLKLMDEVGNDYKIMFSVADFDGDGCSDICFSCDNNSRLVLASRINTLPVRWLEFRKITDLDPNLNLRSQFTHYGNFLGEDHVSLLSLSPSISNNSGTAYIVSPRGVNQYNSVASITDGLGNTTSFEYDCLMPKNINDTTPFYTFSFDTPDEYNLHPTPIPARALKACIKEGINGSKDILRYYYHNAIHHKYGHGFIGFERTTTETYRNSVSSGWKVRKVNWNECETMGKYGMMLPKYEFIYINKEGKDRLIKQSTFGFTNVKLVNFRNDLVVCPALLDQKDEYYSMDSNGERVKTVDVNYVYDYESDTTYCHAYGCVRSDQTVTGFVNGQPVCEQEMTKSFLNRTFPITWIINRPVEETVIFSRNGESVATHTEYEYPSSSTYDKERERIIPNNGSQIHDPLTTETYYGYDSFGNIIEIVQGAPYGTHNEQSRRISYSFGPGNKHRLLEEETAGVGLNSLETVYEYDFQDHLFSTTDCNGKREEYETSPLGIIHKTFHIDGTEKRSVALWADASPYKPENASYYTWEKQTGGKTVMCFFHKSGLELRRVSFDFNGNPVFSDKRYNGDGLLEAESTPYLQGEQEENIKWTTYSYDTYDRVVGIQYADGSAKSFAYDGLSTSETFVSSGDSLLLNPHITIKRNNAMGWLKESIEAAETNAPTTVHYEYYADGNLKWTRIGDDESTKIRLEYDNAGNRILLHDPDYCMANTDLVNEYNAFGEMVLSTTPKNLTTTYVYDEFGRLIQKNEEENTSGGGVETVTTQWLYHELSPHKGLLNRVSHPKQTIDYFYDDFQRVSAQRVLLEGGGRFDTHYTYDTASRIASTTYPSGVVINCHYNNYGYLSSYSDAHANELYRTNKTNPLGLIERYTLGGNIITEREYNIEKQLITNIRTTKGEIILQNLQYDYDGFSNLASRKDMKRNMEERFGYDHLNRLTQIWLGNTQTGVTVYDSYGRMVSKASDGQSLFSNAVYNLTTKPHAIDRAAAYVGVFPSASQSITYTGFDKVKRIEEGSNRLEYTYGYDQQRIRMFEYVDGVERQKEYVGNCELVTETTGNAQVQKWLTYLVGPTGIYAVVVSNNNADTLHYVLKDHLGSWTTITDASGNVEQELSYDAWGSLRNPETWSGNATAAPMFDRGFTGHEHVTAFGLINMNGRCYDPLTSSFLSVDRYVQSPDNAQSFNRYSYCQNNPLRYVDPSGWQMIGGSSSYNSFHENWGVNFAENVITSHDAKQMLWEKGVYIGVWMVGNEMRGGSSLGSDYTVDRKGYIENQGANEKVVDVIYTFECWDSGAKDVYIEIPIGSLKRKNTVLVEGIDGVSYTLDMYNINDDNLSTKLFEFLAANTIVEWSQTFVGQSNSEKSILSTSHDRRREVGQGYLLRKGWTIRAHNHSHSMLFYPSNSDKALAEVVQNKFPNVIHKIYYKNNYYEYDGNGLITIPVNTNDCEIIDTYIKP